MKREGTLDSQLVRPGSTSSELVSPDSVFRTIRNFYPSEEGGLVSVATPHPYLHPSGGGVPANGTPNPATPVYGTSYGIFHAVVQDRDILLLQTDNQIWEFQGWNRQWKRIIANTGSPLVTADLPTPTASDFPTQFVATPTGVVIIPPGSRAYFYDGVKCAQLGYSEAPAPPIGLGPESTGTKWFPQTGAGQYYLGVNDSGYCMDGLPVHPPSHVASCFRQGRVGTVETPGNVSHLAESTQKENKAQVMGYLMPGRYRARTQFVDWWGNLSPMSPESNDIKFQRQPAMTIVSVSAPPPFTLEWTLPDNVLKHIAWDGISTGPTGTVGRIVARTKDLENKGDPGFYELPLDASVNPKAFATLPDNATKFYPDNIPDAWLTKPAEDVEPMPQFRLAAMAFGRLWVANAPGREGALWRSWVGRWGTIQKFSAMWPDPNGAEITGLHAVKNGLLAFTQRGTYLIQEVSSGVFRSEPVSTTVGCVAPSSIVTLRNNITVWLGFDGFYGYDGSSITYLGQHMRRRFTKHSRGFAHKSVACFDPVTGEYRCWVAVEGSDTNNYCYVYDGAGWRSRRDMKAAAVCVTDDVRAMCLAAGVEPTSAKDGVWVVDHWGTPATAVLKTGWINSMSGSPERKTIPHVYLWLRETGTASVDGDKIAVKVRKDYRAEVSHTKYVLPYPELSTTHNSSALNPTLWDATTWGGTGAKWRARRPYWVRVAISADSCEVFQLEVTSTRRFEILGYSFEESPRITSGVHSKQA